MAAEGAGLSGKNIVVTGANTGIGRATAEALLDRGARVVLACRNEDKTRPVLEELRDASAPERVDFVRIDLASLDSVTAAASALLADGRPIHVLINNAGLVAPRGSTTEDGFEMTFGVNHIGHFAFTLRVLDLIPRGGRVVNVSSLWHTHCRSFDFDAVCRPTRSVTGLPEYRASKLANVLFTAESARRWADRAIHTYAVHPGVIASDIWRRLPRSVRRVTLSTRIFRTNEEGARGSIHCATSPEAGSQSGLYYHECVPRKPSVLARDDALAAELWRRSLKWSRIA